MELDRLSESPDGLRPYEGEPDTVFRPVACISIRTTRRHVRPCGRARSGAHAVKGAAVSICWVNWAFVT